MKKTTLIIALATMPLVLFSQSLPDSQEDNMIHNTLLNHYLPENYIEVSQQTVTVDGKNAQLIRYQPKNNNSVQLGTEHFSTVIAKDERLQGFVWLTPHLSEGKLPSKETAQYIAEFFLQQYAPDLHKNKEIHWIKPHDENININGKKFTITGMKVKMRNKKDGRWFWVIIGKNQRPIIFERNIVWISFPGKRQTENWLHDDWLNQRK